METTKENRKSAVRAVVISVVAFGVVPMLVQAQTTAAPTEPGAAQTQWVSQTPAGGPQAGIKVHGHWTIEVRNPDGSLASHHDFENMLGPNGAQALARLLGRFAVAGEWHISLRGADRDHPCERTLPPLIGPEACLIRERGTQPVQFTFPGLVRTLGSPPVTLALSGTATASRQSTIVQVDTGIGWCDDINVSPGVCSAPQLNDGVQRYVAPQFTWHQLLEGISVVPGQIIQVKVVFSFS
jgi:hypothetical protein